MFGEEQRETGPRVVSQPLKERLLPREGLPPLDRQTLRVVERRSTPERARRRGWLIRRLLVLSDAIALGLAFALAESWVDGSLVEVGDAPAFVYVGFGIIGLAVLWAYGLYGRDEYRADHTTIDDLPAIFNAVTLAGFLAFVALVFADESAPELAAAGWAAALVAVPTMRAAGRTIARRRREYVQNTIIVGFGDVGQLMARKLLTHPEYGLRLVGVIDDNPLPLRHDVQAVRVLGGSADTARIIREYEVERAIVAFSGQTHTDELALIRQLRDLDLQVDIVPRLFEIVGPSAGINVFEGLTMMALPPRRLSRGRLMVKRAVDVTVASAAILATLPFGFAIALAILLTDGRPLLYRGERIGAGGCRFRQLKFRTMAKGWTSESFTGWLAENPTHAAEFRRAQKLTDDPRVTRVGRFLRRTSLDELPQLINVLRGDLSLVGPRPITEVEQRERYQERIVHPGSTDAFTLGYWDVEGLRPGLTGYWQISGRSTMSFEERIRVDTAYLTNWSLSLDIAILARTIRALFATRGAY
jgi:exopolysaccharide biosynthesis polyprenyl glycosylphosphotransferase